MELISAERVRILGLFDPASFVVDFREASAPSDMPPNAMELLQLVDANLVAHEYCHFLQTTNTVGGLTQYVNAVNHVAAMLDVLFKAAAIPGEIALPINHNLAQFEGSDLFSDSYIQLDSILRGAAAHFGGTLCASNIKSDYWLAKESLIALGGAVAQPYTYVARLAGEDGRESWIHLGYQHVAEGMAWGIELLRDGLEPSFPADRQRGPRARSLARSSQPYTIAYQAYLAKLKSRGLWRKSSVASLLEFVTLADLAMALDFLFLPGVSQTAPQWLQEHLLRSPSNAFGLLMDLIDGLNRETVSMPLGQVDEAGLAAFQHAALTALCGPRANLKQLAEATIRVADEIFSQLAELPVSPLSEQLLDAMRRLTYQELEYKLGDLAGGPQFFFTLWPDDELKSVFLRSVPSFSCLTFAFAGIGNDLVSDAQEARMIAQTARGIIFGDEPCILHVGRSRTCVVPPQSLCLGLTGLASAHKCARKVVGDQLLGRLLAGNGRWHAVSGG